MIPAIQRFLLNSWLSYRALFDWLNPAGYLSSLVVVPVAFGLLFAKGTRAGETGGWLPVLGSTLLAAANAVVYGTTLAVANERRYGTLPLWMSSPQNLVGALLAKSVLPALNGLVSAFLTIVILAQVLHARLDAYAMLRLSVCVVAVIFSAVGLAMLVAGIALYSRDVLAAPNIVRSIILLGSGAVVSTDLLPWKLHWLYPILPVGHATNAALDIVTDRFTPWALLGDEFGIGLVWGVLGYAVLRMALTASRRRATFEWS